MNVYAIKDRMLDFFIQYFIGGDDKHVLATVADSVNNQESTHAIAQTPHHFEIWRICEIDDQGESTPAKEFLADASSLVREPSRPRGTETPQRPHQRTPQGPESAHTRGERPTGDRVRTGTGNRLPTGEAPKTPVAPQAPHQGTEGLPGHSER